MVGRCSGTTSFPIAQSDSVWWYGGSLLTRASYTWAGAQNFYHFLETSKRGERVASPNMLDRGDVVQMSIDGHVHHTMVVVKNTGSDLLLCYHTDDHLDEPLTKIQSRASDETFIYWKISDTWF